jgi:hypothetical protein
VISPRTILFNYFAITLVCLTLCGLQTTFWHQWTGGAPAPLLWLNVILYLLLYRPTQEGLLAAYYVSLIVTSFSAISLGVLSITVLTVSLIALAVKKRLFWPSTRYFVAMSAGGAFFYHLSYFSVSHIFESNPAEVSFFYRFFEIIQTPLWSAPIFWLLTSVDKFTRRAPPPEAVAADE